MSNGLTTKEYENWLKSIQDTQGYKKYLKYLREFFVQEAYIDFRRRVRAKHSIPPEGYISKVPKVKMAALERDKKLAQEIKNLIETYRLDIYDGHDLILGNILTNMTEPTLVNTRGHTSCIVVDLANESKDKFSKKLRKQEDRLYPIAIRISPHASRRDIRDFIEKLYPTQISKMLEAYQGDATNFNKNRSKNNKLQAIHQFVYENKNIPPKELLQQVKINFGRVFDYAEITKIISTEKKRRK